MPKKAVLVNFSTWVRVVVDLPEGADPSDDQYFDTISEAAIKQFRKYVREDDDYPYPENIREIEEDVELPYGEAPEDKEADEKEVELEIGKIPNEELLELLLDTSFGVEIGKESDEKLEELKQVVLRRMNGKH
jgi:hypothetical protein